MLGGDGLSLFAIVLYYAAQQQQQQHPSGAMTQAVTVPAWQTTPEQELEELRQVLGNPTRRDLREAVCEDGCLSWLFVRVGRLARFVCGDLAPSTPSATEPVAAVNIFSLPPVQESRGIRVLGFSPNPTGIRACGRATEPWVCHVCHEIETENVFFCGTCTRESEDPEDHGSKGPPGGQPGSVG